MLQYVSEVHPYNNIAEYCIKQEIIKFDFLLKLPAQEKKIKKKGINAPESLDSE